MRGLDDDGAEENHIYFNESIEMKDLHLCKGMIFSSASSFRKALREWAIRRGYIYELNKNCTIMVSEVCINKCRFRIHASKLKDCVALQIKTFKIDYL